MRWIDVAPLPMAYSRLMRLAAMRATRVGLVENRLIDAALAAGLTAWAVLEFAHDPVGTPLPLLAMTVPLAWRRARPLIAFGIVGGGFVALVYETNASIRPFGPIALASLLIATYSIVTYAAHRLLAAGAVAVIATAAAARSREPTLPVPSWLVPPLLLGGVWLAARLLREHAERESRTAELAQRLQREQELERQLALQEERERIARELHDIVSHGVSLMVLQSAAARTLTSADYDGRAELLRGVEESGRRALAELRRMLDLLHGASDPPLAPQPSIGQLPELVRRVRDGGLPVELTTEGDARAITPAVGLTVYRVVQEALTNSLKHGVRAGTHVALRYDCDRLRVDVLDAQAPADATAVPSEGRGLLGMRERVSLHGGTLEIGPDQRGAFMIRACLPLQEPAGDDQAADRR